MAYVDDVTGEIDEHSRPFAEILTTLDRGRVHAEASRALHDLISAVRDVGKPGTITITVKVGAVPGNNAQLIVAAQVKTSPPKTDPSAGIFYVDGDGNLTRHDPNQLEIEGLRVVEPKPARVIGGDQ